MKAHSEQYTSASIMPFSSEQFYAMMHNMKSTGKSDLILYSPSVMKCSCAIKIYLYTKPVSRWFIRLDDQDTGW